MPQTDVSDLKARRLSIELVEKDGSYQASSSVGFKSPFGKTVLLDGRKNLGGGTVALRQIDDQQNRKQEYSDEELDMIRHRSSRLVSVFKKERKDNLVEIEENEEDPSVSCSSEGSAGSEGNFSYSKIDE